MIKILIIKVYVSRSVIINFLKYIQSIFSIVLKIERIYLSVTSFRVQITEFSIFFI